MKFEEISKRLTGVSCPISGIQWNPPDARCAVANRRYPGKVSRRLSAMNLGKELAMGT